jgi:ABC-type dipeptide/oligopeptide/nickel transport system ATPase component
MKSDRRHPITYIAGSTTSQVSFSSPRGRVKILEGAHFSLYPGEILALVGETGCGKSVTAKAILDLLPQDRR